MATEVLFSTRIYEPCPMCRKALKPHAVWKAYLGGRVQKRRTGHFVLTTPRVRWATRDGTVVDVGNMRAG
jgi:hypothetical protein